MVGNERGLSMTGFLFTTIVIIIFALVAFRVRVNNPVVDRVIAEVYDRTRKAPYRIEVALGQASWRASSETPFPMLGS